MMQSKNEYYATVYVTDENWGGTADWHTSTHVAQLTHNGDYYRNIAQSINSNSKRHRVILSELREIASTDDTEWGGASYRACLLVKLLLDPYQIERSRDKIYLASPIRASDIYGIYSQALSPGYTFKLFLIQPDASTLQPNEIGIFKEGQTFYYMLKDDEFPMPVTDFHLPEHFDLGAELIYRSMDFMYNHPDAGATLEGKNPSKEFFRKRGDRSMSALTGFISAIAKIDSRVNFHGQPEKDFPYNETREPSSFEYGNHQSMGSFKFFEQENAEKAKSEEKQPAELKKDPAVENHSYCCPLTKKELKNPVFCSLDSKTYTKSAVQGSAILKNHDENTVLFPDLLASKILEDKDNDELLCCPITQEFMQEPVFCILDNNTYEKEAILGWLRKNPTSPISRTRIPAGKEPQDMIFPHHFVKVAIANYEEKQVQSPNKGL